MKALGIETPTLLNKVGELSFRAVLGLQAALGEWMYLRFLQLHDDHEHAQLNDAIWAGSIDIRYLRRETMTFQADNVSPIHGPLQLSKTGARDIADLYQKAVFGAVRYVIGSANLVKYVLPDDKAYQAWFKAVVTRLPTLSSPSARLAGALDIARKKIEPRGVPFDVFGNPLPREAFDPKFPIVAAKVPSLIDAMLVRIARVPNPSCVPRLNSRRWGSSATRIAIPPVDAKATLMRPLRRYIDAAGIHDPRLRFIWDEWNVKSTYEPVLPHEVARLGGLSRRANCAFTIAIAEWILARFQGMDSDPEPPLFLEAAWAAVVDSRYVREIEIVDSEWRGPVRGPISMALTFVIDVLFAEEAGLNSSFNPAWAAVFARHVLPTTVAFDAWVGFCLARLESLYRASGGLDECWFESEYDLETPLPAEAFDPDHLFEVDRTSELIDRYLATLNPTANPFLVGPARMIDNGFKGTPYRYPSS